LSLPVADIVLCFVSGSYELCGNGDGVVSSFSTFSVEAWASYSWNFGFLSFVLVDFPHSLPVGAFCLTDTPFWQHSIKRNNFSEQLS
jgi:hypothetical protein